MMSSKNNGFTASDIERYHSGKMSPEERHALEKAALDDPFLADALEGYTYTVTPGGDLQNIRSRLEEKLNRKKSIPIFRKYRWLSAAAILLIIATGGWLAYQLTTESKNVSLVQENDQPVVKTNLPQPSSNQADSSHNLTPVTKTNVIKESNENKRPSDKKLKKTQPVIAEKQKEEIASEQKKERQVETSLSKPVSAPSTEVRLSSQDNGLVSGKPIDSYKKESVATMLRRSTPAMERTYFNDTSRTLAGRVVSKTDGKDSTLNLNIVLQRLPMDSAEVVVVGYGTQKKSAEPYPKVIIDTLEPAEGYTNFDSYVANNLKMPEELKTKEVSGEVQLSFDVDNKGQPTNITVVKSLCQKCDEEAIRLLKEGPKWKKKKDKKGKITIRF